MKGRRPEAAQNFANDLFRADFIIGAMLGLVAEPDRVENLSGKRFVSSDLERVYANLLPFLVGGFGRLPSRA